MTVNTDSIESKYTWLNFRVDGEKKKGILRLDFIKSKPISAQFAISGKDVFYWTLEMKDLSYANSYYYIRNNVGSALSVKIEGDYLKPILYVRDLKNPYIYNHFIYKHKKRNK